MPHQYYIEIEPKLFIFCLTSEELFQLYMMTMTLINKYRIETIAILYRLKKPMHRDSYIRVDSRYRHSLTFVPVYLEFYILPSVTVGRGKTRREYFLRKSRKQRKSFSEIVKSEIVLA